MAQIIEERITIKISRMVADDSPESTSLINGETIDSLKAVAQELVGEAAIIEIIEGE